ncbi:hypothetical protein AB0H76_08600 [Nocardia sp. NPDC050712]|uniref:hypothetical protein n=1 Tax=Nocardia sp. NPDC050712 TaxID=3155518 RepID=UPI0033CF72A2
MQPIAAGLAVEAVRAQANSARPDAPVRPDPPARPHHLRTGLAAVLRASARQSARLADRLDCAPAHLAHR